MKLPYFSLLALTAILNPFTFTIAAPSSLSNPETEAIPLQLSNSGLHTRAEDTKRALSPVTPVNASDMSVLSAAATVGGYLYTGTYWGGTQGIYSVSTGVCYSFNAPWNNGMGSYQPNIGSYCTVWDSNTCTGGYISNMHYPGLENLQTFHFINVPSSITCWLE